MSLGLFVDLDGVMTPKAVNLQYAAMLGIESDLIRLEDQYANGLIDNAEFNAGFIPLFRKAGFTQQFAQERFAQIILTPFVTELLQVNLPDVYIITSSPSYYVDQFARKFGIPKTNVICSRYSFDDQGLLSECISPCGVMEKANFVENRVKRFTVSVGVGDSPEQDAKFMNQCTLRVLMGGERRNYLHAVDLFTLQSLMELIRSLLQKGAEPSPACQAGIDHLLSQSKFENNVFIITPFRPDARYIAAIKAVRDELNQRGFRGWTADEIDLGDDLWINVRCFIHACQRGVAIITADEKQTLDSIEIRKDVYNPNVIAEAGYMLGQGKEVLLLKDSRVQLPTDWIGKLFRSINFANPEPDVREAVRRWIQHRA